MSSDATTLRLRDAPLADRQAADGSEQRTRAQARARREARIAAGALIVLVGLSLLFVVIAANRPNLFTATARAGFFPGWMAGPLGGLLPGLTRSSTVLKSTFSGGMIVMYVSYLLALVYAPSRLNPRWTIAAIVSAQAIFFLAPPMALTDIFNYINYGRMEVIHHLNPYTTFPVLEPHSDPSYALSNWHELLSPYGPLFTLFTFALVPLGVAASFWTIKVLLLAASLGTVLLVWRCAQLLELDPVKAILLVGLNPIVLVWGLGGDHNDFLMVFFIVLGFYLLLRAREHAAPNERPAAQPANGSSAAAVASEERAPARGLRARLWPLSAFDLGAGAAFVVAAALKASAGVLIPIVLLALWRSPRRVLGVVLGMVAVGAVLSRREPDRLRPTHPRSEHAGEAGHQFQRSQPDRDSDRQRGRDRNAAQRAQCRAVAVGARLLRARLAPARIDHAGGLGDGGAAGDARLGAALVRAVAAAAGRAVALAAAADDDAGARRLPDPGLDAGLDALLGRARLSAVEDAARASAPALRQGIDVLSQAACGLAGTAHARSRPSAHAPTGSRSGRALTVCPLTARGSRRPASRPRAPARRAPHIRPCRPRSNRSRRPRRGL